MLSSLFNGAAFVGYLLLAWAVFEDRLSKFDRWLISVVLITQAAIPAIKMIKG